MEAGLALALVVIFLLAIASSPDFLSSYSLFTMGTNIGDLAILALPMTLIIVTGEIDLSIASILALGGELLGILWMHHWPIGLIFLTVLAMGAVAGAINGVLVTRVGLPSLAVTIGTLTLYRGLANVLLGANTVSNFPATYTNLGVLGVPGLPFLSYSVLFFLILAAIFAVVLHATPLGRSLFAIGSSAEAALFAGIRVKRIKLMLYVLSGVVSAAVGMLYTFELASAGEGIGIGFELKVVTIVLLGGVSIFGGKGTIAGVVLAAFVYAGLHSLLLLSSSFNDNDFQVVAGGLLVLSVLVPNAPLFVSGGREMARRGKSRWEARSRRSDETEARSVAPPS
jgi:rhamnose transport system permease protein